MIYASAVRPPKVVPCGIEGVQAMLEPAKYSAAETLRDGRRVEIRALRPEDQAGLLAAVDRTSSQSLYRRFFGTKRGFTDREVDFFMNIDFISHVALVAVIEQDGREAIVGGGRYVVVEPGKAELAFVVVDEYQGQGVGAALMRHLATIARAAGLDELIADVLPENVSMLRLFKKSGLLAGTEYRSGSVHVTLRLA